MNYSYVFFLILLVSCQPKPVKDLKPTDDFKAQEETKPSIENFEKKEETMDGVHTKITVISEGKVEVTLEITNHSDHAVHLDPFKIFAKGEVKGPRFRVTKTGKEVDYLGMMAKRKRTSPDDFLKLDIGESYKNTFDLTKFYAFENGKHAYEIQFEASHWFIDIPEAEEAWTTKSNSVKFEFTK